MPATIQKSLFYRVIFFADQGQFWVACDCQFFHIPGLFCVICTQKYVSSGGRRAIGPPWHGQGHSPSALGILISSGNFFRLWDFRRVMTTGANEQGSENLRGTVKVTHCQLWVIRYSHVVWRFPKCVFWKDDLVCFGLGVQVGTPLQGQTQGYSPPAPGYKILRSVGWHL